MKSIKQLHDHLDVILSHFESNEIFNISDLEKIGRKPFASNLSHELGSKKLNTPSLKLFAKLKRLNAVNAPNPETLGNEGNDLENVSCGRLQVLGSSLAEQHFEAFLNLLTQQISKCGVDGNQFVSQWNQYKMSGDAREFDAFFNDKICGFQSFSSGSESDKFQKFREWILCSDLDENEERVQMMNSVEFGQFIVDRYTAFIGHIFVEEQVDGRRLMNEGFKRIANGMCDRYGIAKGPMTKLCREMEDRVKNGKVTVTENKHSGQVAQNGMCVSLERSCHVWVVRWLD